MKLCPCGSHKRYLECCGACIRKKISAETPEALMRSRYTAYVENDIQYIQKTMRGLALSNFNKREAKKKVEWIGLEVMNASIDSDNPEIGFVEFKVKYKLGKQEVGVIHEKSEFHRIEGRWYYMGGEHEVG
jgi:SEC-C motif-containing protein